jgi:hypothetical protein
MWKMPKPKPVFKAVGPCCRVYFAWDLVTKSYRLHRSCLIADYVWRSN